MLWEHETVGLTPTTRTSIGLSSNGRTTEFGSVDRGSIPCSPANNIFLCSSMVEHSTVNRVVVGSSPTWEAIYLIQIEIIM